MAKAAPARSRPRSLLRRIVFRLFQVVALFLISTTGATSILRWIAPPTTAVILGRRLEAWRGGRKYGVDFRWIRWNQISPNAALAVIAAEDQHFATHHGFDFDSIQKALDEHERGRRLRGASTISQQVAKNLFL